MRLLASLQVILDAHARRRRERRQAALAELDLEVAAARDLDRVLERLRDVGEELRHLVLALEVLLGREALRPALVAEHVALRDADARLVRAEVAGVEELHRVRGHHRQAQARGERHRAREQRLGVRLARRAAARGSSGPGRALAQPLREPLGGLAVAGERAPARRRPPPAPERAIRPSVPPAATRARARPGRGAGCAARRATAGRTGAGSRRARRTAGAGETACRGRRRSAASSRRR